MMKLNRIIIIYKIVVTLIFISMFCSFLFSFNYNPRRFELIETANNQVSYQIELTNSSTITENVTINLNSWIVSDNKATFYPLTETWIVLDTSNIKLLPETSTTVGFRLIVPDVLGEKRAEINFNTMMEGSNFTLSRSIPVFLIVGGTDLIDIEITKVYVALTDDGHLQVSTVFQNNGNIHIRPRVEFRITGEENWIRIADDVPIYPESERIVSKELGADELLDGREVEVRMMYYNSQGEIITKHYFFSI
ncbi:MAG: hypothetical protein A2Y40_00175 [Candidatus Margulisbacteria bacterium GWF2_35_9]|nr:MAG: hypothetical protein A2Y40_00175 [Candidatus Margulisbacteria bacterium GWF2_35_9]